MLWWAAKCATFVLMADSFIADECGNSSFTVSTKDCDNCCWHTATGELLLSGSALNVSVAENLVCTKVATGKFQRGEKLPYVSRPSAADVVQGVSG